MIHLGACEEVLPTFTGCSVDAIVTDPPYGLGTREPTAEEIDSYLQGISGIDTGGDFMGKKWDIPSVFVWKELYRILKDGHLLFSFAGTRTLDIFGLGIEAAGFKKLGSMLWVHGQGWPKAGDMSKAIAKAGGSAEEQAEWTGWATQLKPAWEPILVYSKGEPLEPFDFSEPFIYSGKVSKAEATLDGRIENNHPTKKPLSLMRALVKRACLKGGLILDPYMGSGTTAVASVLEGYKFLGSERDPVFQKMATERVQLVSEEEEAARPWDLDSLFGSLEEE